MTQVIRYVPCYTTIIKRSLGKREYAYLSGSFSFLNSCDDTHFTGVTPVIRYVPLRANLPIIVPPPGKTRICLLIRSFILELQDDTYFTGYDLSLDMCPKSYNSPLLYPPREREYAYFYPAASLLLVPCDDTLSLLGTTCH
ncbi:hypothetical protein AVEN_243337-1 [Araneus ventricosus]|uniref:Uncharacterized protein n=1 Tax=Araneus ventricosus TaxID=182803 RepID=A0A4Y2HBC0_ARAVE|nr:hypothetical protein AVEN_243337-1 [Araneus ventricosus]